jgi:hypothetical protein
MTNVTEKDDPGKLPVSIQAAIPAGIGVIAVC